MKYKRLNEVFPVTLLENGIFKEIYMELGTSNPFTREIAYNEINLQYHFNNSGDKIISPLVKKLLGDKNELSQSDRTELAKIIVGLYKLKWSNLFETLYLEYNPISNYDMTETETINTENDYNSTSSNDSEQTNNTTKTTTDSTTTNASRTDTTTNNLTERTEVDNTDTTNNTYTGTDTNNVSAFNSTSFENKMQDSSTNTTQNTLTQDGTTVRTNTGTSSISSEGINTTTGNTTDTTQHTFTDDSTNTTEGENKTNTSRTLTRTGNIGVTTSQQMIQSSRELWEWLIFDVVFKDVDKVLTLEIY